MQKSLFQQTSQPIGRQSRSAPAGTSGPPEPVMHLPELISQAPPWQSELLAHFGTQTWPSGRLRRFDHSPVEHRLFENKVQSSSELHANGWLPALHRLHEAPSGVTSHHMMSAPSVAGTSAHPAQVTRSVWNSGKNGFLVTIRGLTRTSAGEDVSYLKSPVGHVTQRFIDGSKIAAAQSTQLYVAVAGPEKSANT